MSTFTLDETSLSVLTQFCGDSTALLWTICGLLLVMLGVLFFEQFRG